MIASGLSPELEFEKEIAANIEANDGTQTPLEGRMLASIQRHFDAAGLTRDEVYSSKRLPDLSAMFRDIGWSRLQYVVLQRLGSHAVHGNWPSLLSDYLEQTDVQGFDFMPRGDPKDAHVNMFMTGARITLKAISAYCNIMMTDPSRNDFEGLAQEAHELLMRDYRRAVENGL